MAAIGDTVEINGVLCRVDDAGTNSIAWGQWIVVNGESRLHIDECVDVRPAVEAPEVRDKPFYTQGRKKKGGNKSWA